VKVQHFAAEAQTLDVSKMRRLNPAKRYTLAAAFLTLQYAQALDDLTEMFIKRMRQLHHSAKAALAQYRLNTQQQTDTLIVTLRDLIIAYQLEGEVSDRFAAIATVMGEQPEAILKQCEAILSYDGNNYFPFLPQFYRTQRSVLFRLLDGLSLQPSNHETALVAAIQFIKQHRGKQRTWISLLSQNTEAVDNQPAPSLDITWIPPKWWVLVTGQRQRLPTPTQVHRIFFELCVFSHLLLELQSDDLYLEGSQEDGNYDEQLIPWTEYQTNVEE